MRIEAVLFDFGGVFLDSPFAAVRSFGACSGVGEDRILELVFGRYDTDTDHPWHRLERGEITLTDARQAILDLAAPDRVDLLEALGAMARASIRDEMVEIARFARAAGRRTALVTNNVREFGDGWRAMLPVDDLFDAVVDSHQVGVRKPDPRIFTYALEQLGGVSCASAVFLDDFHGNVAAAERLGMRASWWAKTGGRPCVPYASCWIEAEMTLMIEAFVLRVERSADRSRGKAPLPIAIADSTGPIAAST